MPIPASFTDLDPNPNNNSPQGTENVGPNANGYIQALAAFIKQIYLGSLAPTAALNVNAQKITNLAAGSTTSTSTDALTGAQVRAFAYKVGEQRWWNSHGQAILGVWGPGWQLADGTNGTLDMRDRSPVATGSVYGLGTTVGATSVTLSIGNMPVHNHGVTDPSHNHAHSESPHTHTDSGHAHLQNAATLYITGPNFSVGAGSGLPNSTGAVATGVASAVISSTTTGVANVAASTGITTVNAGSGTAFDNRPPLIGVVCIEYTGLGA